MNRFTKVQPKQYVDTFTELPLKELQGLAQAKQKTYDDFRTDKQKLMDDASAITPGMYTGDLYKEYKANLDSMTEDIAKNLVATQDLTGAKDALMKAKAYANNYDSKVIRKDYEYTQKYIANKMDPKNANAWDMANTRYKGYQVSSGEDVIADMYGLVGAEDGLKNLTNLAQNLKPTTTDNGKTWSIPSLGISGLTSDKVKGVTKQKLQSLTNDYYDTWKVSGDSYYDRVRLSNGHPEIFNTEKGKQLYDDYVSHLHNLNWSEDLNDGSGSGSYRNSNSNNNGNGSEYNPNIKESFTVKTATPYGSNHGLGKSSANGEYIQNKFDYDNHTNYLENQRTNITKGIIAQYPDWNSKTPEEKASILKSNPLWAESNNQYQQALQEQRDIEGDLTEKVDPKKIQQATQSYTDLLKHTLDLEYPGETNQEQLKDWENLKSENDVKNYLTKYNIGKGTIYYDEIQKFLSGNEEYKNLKNNALKQVLGQDENALKIYQRYEDAANDQNVGYSVLVPVANKPTFENFFNYALQSEMHPRSTMTNKEISNYNEFKERVQALPKEMKDNITYTINLDDEDGTVLTVGIPGEQSVEFTDKQFLNIGEALKSIDPGLSVLYTKFNEATTSLNNNNRKKGSFKLDDVEIPFERKYTDSPSGKKDYNYVFTKPNGEKEIYTSLHDLIETKTTQKGQYDNNVNILKQQIQQLVNSGNFQEAQLKDAALQKYISEGKIDLESSLGKRVPQTKDPLNLGF